MGYAYYSGNVNYSAFVYIDSTMHPLGTLGGRGSAAMDINNHGQIVGGSFITLDSEVTHGFLYANGVMTDLNDLIDPELGWEILKGMAINDQGQIVGWGMRNGVRRGFLMTPVPEPSGMTLWLFAVAGLTLLRRYPSLRNNS